MGSCNRILQVSNFDLSSLTDLQITQLAQSIDFEQLTPAQQLEFCAQVEQCAVGVNLTIAGNQVSMVGGDGNTLATVDLPATLQGPTNSASVVVNEGGAGDGGDVIEFNVDGSTFMTLTNDKLSLNGVFIDPPSGLELLQQGAVPAVATDPMNTLWINTADGHLYRGATDVEDRGAVDVQVSANMLTLRDDAGAQIGNAVDLSLYLDDSNLARVTSGTLDNLSGVATFTRDDSSTFTVDFSSFLDDFTFTGATATTAGVQGDVPAPAAGDEAKFLRGDGTWQTNDAAVDVQVNADMLTLLDSNGVQIGNPVDLTPYLDNTNLARIVSGALDSVSGVVTLTRDDSSTLTVDLSSFLSTFTGATTSTAGTQGAVPAPAAGDEEKFLRGDGTWQTNDGAWSMVDQTASTFTINDGIGDKFWRYNGSGPGTWTLPIPNIFSPGARIMVNNLNSTSDDLTLITGTGSGFLDGSGGNIPSLTLSYGQTYTFVRMTAGAWQVTAVHAEASAAQPQIVSGAFDYSEETLVLTRDDSSTVSIDASEYKPKDDCLIHVDFLGYPANTAFPTTLGADNFAVPDTSGTIQSLQGTAVDTGNGALWMTFTGSWNAGDPVFMTEDFDVAPGSAVEVTAEYVIGGTGPAPQFQLEWSFDNGGSWSTSSNIMTAAAGLGNVGRSYSEIVEVGSNTEMRFRYTNLTGGGSGNDGGFLQAYAKATSVPAAPAAAGSIYEADIAGNGPHAHTAVGAITVDYDSNIASPGGFTENASLSIGPQTLTGSRQFNAGLYEVEVSNGSPTGVQGQIRLDGNVVQLTGDTGGIGGAVGFKVDNAGEATIVGEAQVFIESNAVSKGNANDGDVFTLIDSATGESEYRPLQVVSEDADNLIVAGADMGAFLGEQAIIDVLNPPAPEVCETANLAANYTTGTQNVDEPVPGWTVDLPDAGDYMITANMIGQAESTGSFGFVLNEFEDTSNPGTFLVGNVGFTVTGPGSVGVPQKQSSTGTLFYTAPAATTIQGYTQLSNQGTSNPDFLGAGSTFDAIRMVKKDGVTPLAFGTATVSSNLTLSATFQPAPGGQVTLPAAGKYLVFADARCVTNGGPNSITDGRLFNVTDGAEVPGTVSRLMQGYSPNSAQRSCPITTIMDVSGPTDVRLEGKMFGTLVSTRFMATNGSFLHYVEIDDAGASLAQLAGNFTPTSTWQDVGLSVNLSSAGVQRIVADVRGAVTGTENDEIRIRLWDATAGVEVPNSEMLLCTGRTSGPYEATAGTSACYNAPGANEIRVQAMVVGSPTLAEVRSDVDGQSRLVAYGIADVQSLIISGDAGNAITAGSDGGAYLEESTPGIQFNDTQVTVFPLACNDDLASTDAVIPGKSIVWGLVDSNNLYSDAGGTVSANPGDEILNFADPTTGLALTTPGGSGGPDWVETDPLFNGRSVLSFNSSSNDSLAVNALPGQSNFNLPFSLVYIFSLSSGGNNASIMSASAGSDNLTNGGTGNATWQIGRDQTSDRFIFRAGNDFSSKVLEAVTGTDNDEIGIGTWTEAANGQPHVLVLDYDGTNIRVYMDGTLRAEAVVHTNGLSQRVIRLASNRGFSSFTNMNVAEFAMFDATLTGAELDQVQAYLLCKFGLDASQLAATGPFAVDLSQGYGSPSQFVYHRYLSEVTLTLADASSATGTEFVFDKVNEAYYAASNVPVPGLGAYAPGAGSLGLLRSFADDAAAGAAGLSAGEVYQTDGTAFAPLNVAGIVMVKQ